MARVAWPGDRLDDSEVVTQSVRKATVEVGDGNCRKWIVGWRGQRTRCSRHSSNRNSSSCRRLSRSVRQQLESSSMSVVQRLTLLPAPSHAPVHPITLQYLQNGQTELVPQSTRTNHVPPNGPRSQGQNVIYSFAIHNTFYSQNYFIC